MQRPSSALPLLLTLFIRREQEVADALRLLMRPDVCLLTLIGTDILKPISLCQNRCFAATNRGGVKVKPSGGMEAFPIKHFCTMDG